MWYIEGERKRVVDNLLPNDPSPLTEVDARVKQVRQAIADCYWDALARQVDERQDIEFRIRCIPVERLISF